MIIILFILFYFKFGPLEQHYVYIIIIKISQ